MRQHDQHRFTLLELIIVCVVVVILAGMLLPILAIARNKASYARWLGYKNGLRTHSNLVAMYDFEEEGNILLNQAVGPDAIKNYMPESLNVPIQNPEWVDGRWHAKKAVKFDNDTYAQATDLPRYLPAVDHDMTIVWWFNVTSAEGTQNAIDMRPDGPGAVQPGLRDGKVSVWRSGGTPLVESTETPETNRWNQAVYTLSGDGRNFTNRLWVNGNLVATTDTLPQTGYTERLTIGRYSEGSEFWQGSLDEILIFDAVITDQEIDDDWQMGNPR